MERGSVEVSALQRLLPLPIPGRAGIFRPNPPPARKPRLATSWMLGRPDPRNGHGGRWTAEVDSHNPISLCRREPKLLGHRRKNGSRGRVRTADALHVEEALCQLSYSTAWLEMADSNRLFRLQGMARCQYVNLHSAWHLCTVSRRGLDIESVPICF